MAESESEPPISVKVDSPSAQTRTKGETSVSENEPLPPLEMPLPPKGQTTTCQCRPDQTPRWKQVLEVGAFCLGIALAVIYFMQLNAMNGQLEQMAKQYPEIKKSADAAQKAALDADQSLSHSIDFFKIDQEPRLRITSREIGWDPKNEGNPLTANYHYANVGKTEAQVIGVDKHVTIIPFVKNAEDVTFPSVLPLRSNSTEVLQQNDERLISAFNRVAGATSQEEVLQKKKLLVSYGCIEYRDVFGDTHWTDFCDIRQPAPNDSAYAICRYTCKREAKR